MKGKLLLGMIGGLALAVTGSRGAQASFEPSVETAYNMAVQGLELMDGLEVTVSEQTVTADTNHSAQKEVRLQLSGRKANALKVGIWVTTEEGQEESYYQNDYYYTSSSNGDIKQSMDAAAIWEIVNSHIYLDMTSNYLKMLCAEAQSDGTVLYRFAATEDTLAEYSQKLLTKSAQEQGMVIDSLFGTMETDADGHILKRDIEMVYSVTSGEEEQTFLTQTEAVFAQNNGSVTVEFPDLSGYRELESEKPAETIQQVMRTVYVTADVNVRAEGNIGAAILGGFFAGSGVTQTGYTSDGWVQVQYNGAVGYIWGDYVSLSKPVITRNQSGTMYATAAVNVRSTHSSEGTILGVLTKGQSVEITGATDNDWIRVKYNDQTGYVYAAYLSWSAPVSDTYIANGHIMGTVVDASFGALTIQKAGTSETMTFNTTYAELLLEDTIFNGDLVEIEYYGSGSPYTASKVIDDMNHEGSVALSSCTVDGIVVVFSRNRLELSGSDGIYRTFDISDADIEMPYDPVAGQYVMVTWMSYTGGAETKNISAMRVMG